MMKLCLNVLVLCAVVAGSANVSRSQSASKALFNPPSWIVGEWTNLAEADLRNHEAFVFTPHEIELTKGVGETSKAVKFSQQFKNYKVKETVELDLYRVEIHSDKNEYVYEFKLSARNICASLSPEALTYSVTKNKKSVRTHSTSIHLVLFRPIRVK